MVSRSHFKFCAAARFRALQVLVLAMSVAGLPVAPWASEPALSLEEAERLAVTDEPGFTSQLERAQGFREQAVADRQLPDPVLALGALNVPTDDFSLDVEPMTQMRVGVRQLFPRGHSRRIRHDIALSSADELASNAAARYLWVKREVRIAWLDVAYWEVAREIVARDRPLFEQLRDVTASLYRVGRKDLQDVVRSELELQRLEDRLTAISELVERSRSRLARWVGPDAGYLPLGGGLPAWNVHLDPNPATQAFVDELLEHPLIVSMDNRVRQRDQIVDLARQNYKPNWMVDVSYGNRQAERADGSGVPDVWSAAVTLDLPLFQSKRQDRTLEAANRRYQAAKDDRLERVRALVSNLDAARARWARLEERKRLHIDLILPQAAEQAEAALLSYQSDTGDFTEVMRARIFDLTARLDYEQINSETLKALAELRYLIPPDADKDGLSVGSPSVLGQDTSSRSGR